MSAFRSPQRGATDGSQASLAELVGMRHAVRGRALQPGRAAAAALAGPYRSAASGRGMDFDEVRVYQPGDDVRTIDWRVTARTGRPHSKLFHEERERPVWLCVDLGPSMQFGTRCAFKSVAAARAAALVAWEARATRDRVGALIRSPAGVELFPPQTRESQLFRILGSLARGTASRGGAPAESVADSLARLNETVRSGSRVVMLSDFYDFDAGARKALAPLSRRAEVLCVLVYDALEAEAPPPGRYRISDGSRIQTLDAGGERWRRAYTRHFEERRAALTGWCRSRRVGLSTLRTDEDPAAALAPVLDPSPARRRSRRAA